MYNILFFILVCLLVIYVVHYFVNRFYPLNKKEIVLDRHFIQDDLVETITREGYANKEIPTNPERDATMTHYHINGRSLDKQHLM
tara:strand:- start:225 stop:479 length:255 start_codon:yes stop_codon:yes gene_type:complete